MKRNRTQTGRATWCAWGLVGSLTLGACSSTDDSPGGDDTETTAAADDASATRQAAQTQGEVIALADGVQIPDGAAGEAFLWFVDILNTPDTPDAAEAKERFAPSLLDQIGAEDAASTFDEIRALAPLRVTSVEASPGTLSASVDGEQALVIDLGVDDDGMISALTYRPDPLAGRAAPENYDQVDQELSELSQQHNILAATVEDGQCVPVFERKAKSAAPAGSAFKLYVLGALVDSVERGDLTWDQELTVTDQIKSLPGGRLEGATDGTKVTVEQAAGLMISISDNTATDMLIEAIGVQAVEDVYADMGVRDPDGLTPLPTTSQLFQLGWGVEDAIRETWSGADTKTQRQILADLPSGVPDIDAESATVPRWADGIDWFVSAADLCSAHVALQERASTPAGEPVASILAENAGAATLAQDFDYLAFKGGELPGAATLTWYGEVGEQDLVAIVQVSSDETIDTNDVLGPGSDVLTLLRRDAVGEE